MGALAHKHLVVLTAILIAALIAIPTPVSPNLSFGALAGLAIAPAAIRDLLRTQTGRWLSMLLVLAIPAGYLTAAFSVSADPGRQTSSGWAMFEVMIVIGLTLSVLGSYWSVRKIGPELFLLLVSLSLVAKVITSQSYHDNAWKYGLALPITVIALLIARGSRTMLAFVWLPLLLAANVAFSYRSWLAITVATTLLAFLWRSRRDPPSKLMIAGVGLGTFFAVISLAWAVVQLALAGALGQFAQRRTMQQLDVADNLLLGGRPEWGAALGLLGRSPMGLGVGVVPSEQDYILAIRSMPFASPELQETSTVAQYFDSGQVAFHSSLWTFWGTYGLIGGILVVVLIALCARAVIASIVGSALIGSKAAMLVVLMGGIWDYLFSPTPVAQMAIPAALAIWLLDESRRESLEVPRASSTKNHRRDRNLK